MVFHQETLNLWVVYQFREIAGCNDQMQNIVTIGVLDLLEILWGCPGRC